MTDILALLQCLAPCLTRTTIRQMSHIIGAIVTMAGRVTMRGISRWTDEGGSYHKRFFHTMKPWGSMFRRFFRQHLLNPEAVYLLAGDEAW
jgi:putative transposase